MPAPIRYWPPGDVRRALAAARERGESFDAAWDAAVRSVTWPTDGQGCALWREALRWTREEWRRAYEGEPSEVGLAAAALIGALDSAPGQIARLAA